MRREKMILEIKSRIRELPTLPAVLTRLLQVVEDDGSDAADVVEVITPDPALTAKVLKVANSAYYGLPSSVANLERAVPLLGMGMVKSLALSIGVVENIPHAGPNPHFSRAGLWTHSLAVATVLDEMAKRLKLEAGHLFSLGLLHDVGHIVLDLFFPELFIRALQTANEENIPLNRAETEVIGLDHGEVGAILLSHWKFPKPIVNPTAAHHHDSRPEGVDEIDAAMLRISDLLALEQGFVATDHDSKVHFGQDELDILEIDLDRVGEFRKYLTGQGEKIASFWDSMSGG